MKHSADASMELLNSILKQTVDPDYLAFKDDPKARTLIHKLLALIVCALAGLMFMSSALHQGRARPQAVSQRDELINRINDVAEENDSLRAQVADLNLEIDQMSENIAKPYIASDEDSVEIISGAIDVQGEGVVIQIEERSSLPGQESVVIDQDLRYVVNGLWEAGAEAIAINGHRITSRTAIRQAGQAITVNYRSLSAPYRIEAIGDKNQLPAKFANSSGGALLSGLKQNYGIKWSIQVSKSLTLASDTSLQTTRARPA